MGIFSELSISTGISEEKLQVEANLIERMRELFSRHEPGYALYGGTALNMVYFGKKQRISYDLDVRADNFEECEKNFSGLFRHEIKTPKMHRFVDENGIRIDLASGHSGWAPKRRRANAILHYFGFPVYSADILTYDFECLFAEKIMAFTARGLPKDLYDVWLAKSQEFDEKLLLKRISELWDRTETDPRVIITDYHHADTDMGKIDSTIPALDGKEMYAEVKDFIRLLYFES